MSFINTLNKSETSIEPCGTPALTFLYEMTFCLFEQLAVDFLSNYTSVLQHFLKMHMSLV